VLLTLQQWQSNVTSTSAPISSSGLDAEAQGDLEALRKQMTASGFAALLAFVRAEKKNMKRVLVPDMGQGNH
jgi:hypothetical protein